jgi:hypothetical protein
MMHEQFASRQRPLYGRAAEHLVLDEIAPEDLTLFLPRYSQEQIVETYSVIGGIPGYLELWDDRRPVLRNIEQRILAGTTFFAQEATLLIQDEIAEPRTYLAILEAIGARRRTPAELSAATGITLPFQNRGSVRHSKGVPQETKCIFTPADNSMLSGIRTADTGVRNVSDSKATWDFLVVWQRGRIPRGVH